MTGLTEELFEQLRAAFVAEASTVVRFRYFAQIAEIEGSLEAARLFTELAESAACVAHGHLDILQTVTDPATDRPIDDTELNLADAVSSEMEAATAVYPALGREAQAEGLADLTSWFETLTALKQAHLVKLTAAREVLLGGAPAAAVQDKSTSEG
ncbi:ferritin family protein [Paractinoplanes hotanensis]|uniref:Rubrerythrin diiron-binding domain-containing protein n=1 Tax=Paractinoplanes hotanensis TaxID=2906497 RepID=A0ABT0YBV6_9ACTN|nr:ferritin family protein [Actinoplanes hotanensis]MCM4083543.1 hypothetical protein [Actinoplanes hotanensis]